ncbi:galactose mutarotase-like isoform X2 [Lineus longissimus]|uniref:galactose mutarotase-like isoform X2 n=1 Tax=Lineus longissimus TaxID=88925 RepID=UPI00315DF0A2
MKGGASLEVQAKEGKTTGFSANASRNLLILSILCLLLFCLFILFLILFIVGETSRRDCAQSQAGVTLTKSSFGETKDGKKVDKFTFSNENGMSYSVITYGAIITEIKVPDKDGKIEDVCLGYDDQKGYDANVPYFGAIIGRVVNRIANGRFELDGVNYTVPINNEGNSLHGGIKAFDKRIWESSQQGNKLILKLFSPDGDEGYPGDLTVYVTYELTNQNELIINMNATTTKATPINMANHAYFNLAGQASGAVYDHIAMVKGPKYLPADKELKPTGEIKSVVGTPFDLLKPTRLGDVLSKLPVVGDGFDTNFCLEGTTGRRFTARVVEPKSGRVLEVWTNQPAVQLYTGNFLQGTVGKGGVTYQKHGAFCLETQNYPDAINHKDTFPDSVLRPRSTYEHHVNYKFSIDKS